MMESIMEWVFIIFIGLLIFYRKRIARILNFIGEYAELKITGALAKLMQKIEDKDK